MKTLDKIHADRFYTDLALNGHLIEETVEGQNEDGDALCSALTGHQGGLEGHVSKDVVQIAVLTVYKAPFGTASSVLRSSCSS